MWCALPDLCELKDWAVVNHHASLLLRKPGPQAGQETSEGVAGSFIPSPPPGAPSPPPATGSTQPQLQQAYTLGLAPRNLAHLQQQQQQQQPPLVLPEQAQASALRPSQPCPHPVSPRAAKARSCPLLTAVAPAAATATPSAAGTAVAGFPGGGAAAAEPPAALTAACMRGLEGGDAPLAQLPQAGVLCRGHHAPTKPQVSRLARSHTYTGALDREGGSNRNSGSGDEDADEGPAFSTRTFNITDTSPAATSPPTLHALSKPEQQLPPQPQLQLSEQPLHSLQQQRVFAPLPLTIEPQPPRSPPPQDDHPAHRVRHRSWSQLSLTSSMLQQHTAPSPAPALAAIAPTGAGRPRTPEVASAPCVQPPPSKIASAPLAPTPCTSHPHSFTIFPAHKATFSSAPLFSPAAAACTPGTGGLDCASFDLIPPRPPLSPQSLLPSKRPSFEHRAFTPPSPEAENTSNTSISNTSTSTISNSNTTNTSKTGNNNTSNTSIKGVAAVGGSRPHSAAVHFTSPFRCHPDSISPLQAPPHSATIRERRCRSLCLLRSSSSLEQIRERLGRIQTAGAENKQRRSSLLLGAPLSGHSNKSNNARAPANSTTTSHSQLSLPLPAPCPQRSVPGASISCSDRANLDAPPPLLLHSHSDSSSSSSHANAAAPVGQVMELDDWLGATKLPTSMYFDLSEQAKGNADELQEKSKEHKKKIQDAEEREKEVTLARDKKLATIGNLVHDSVPVSNDEANNTIVKECGECRQEEKLYNHVDLVQTQKPALGRRAGLSRSPAMLPLDAPPAASASAVAAATGASVPPIPCTMPAIKGDKKDKQPLQAQQADGSSTPAMCKVASAQELSAALAAGTAPAGLRGPGVDCSTAEHAHAAPEGARPAAQEVTRAAAQEGAHADPASSGSGSSCSPFQLLSGRSGSGRAGALWDSGCELCRCSSNSSSGNCCSRCGADTSSAKARPLSSAIHSASSRCHSSSGASSSAPSAALSSALSISAPSHLSRCSSSTTNSSSASGSFKEQPAVTAAAAALEYAGFRHSLAPADVPEGQSRAVVEPAYSGLASVPETELEVAEESVVAGSEGGVAGAAGALAAAGPDGLVLHEQQQQQQQQSKEGVAGERLGAKLLASLMVVGSVAKNAY
ncbi:hypothetical protein DUNSADRAFT_6512 [Dunaliella salina]|uniref:Uncharacterized protein n=1 Tax=Dunaliella salina TaxID=3046 RepID=A0ABQ7GN63_DUNSA|nr:hypothetical protein DUNSADRAFT_6512 [Dunaliella salina]|eukprot:KAF5836042.1 hypothetical protein DUNSADRAFT_6512 [Dunaliella salina]